jgi:uncharacterized protein (DUF1330 family)
VSAYVIAEMEVTDSVLIEEYRKLAGASIAAHGGRFIVRGGNLEALEGEWHPKRLVAIEFPDADAARAWWASEEYARARLIRDRAARGVNMVLVEGVA